MSPVSELGLSLVDSLVDFYDVWITDSDPGEDAFHVDRRVAN